jgi:glycosyltransferase involved in cell wall biosynthesis
MDRTSCLAFKYFEKKEGDHFMKILLATYWVLPHLGGVWPFMSQLKAKLESLGHEVDLLSNANDSQIIIEDRALSKGHFLHFLDTKLTASSYPALRDNQWVYHAELERYCFELASAYLGLEKYDVIHTQDVISAQSINRVKPTKTPLVTHIHGSVAGEVQRYLEKRNGTPGDSLVWAYYKAIEHNGATAPDVAITANYWVKNVLKTEFDVPDEQVRVFQYGLNTEDFLKQMQEYTPVERPLDKKVIISTGRIVEIKGLQYMISALALLKQSRDDWVYWIVGEGDEIGALQQQTVSLGLQEHVQFLGRRDDIPQLLNISDIFVQPSIIDNQPLSLIEAQVAGIPAIVSNAGGLPEMVENGQTGLISAVGDVETLFHHLNLLLSNEEYRKALGANARAWGMTHWSLDLMVDRLLEVYEYAISERGKQYGNV